MDTLKYYTMDVTEIAEKLVEQYPDSRMAHNDIIQVGNNTPEYREMIFQHVYEHFEFEILGCCGCGRPQYVLDDVRKGLTILDDHGKSHNITEYYNKWSENLGLYVDETRIGYSKRDEGIQLFLMYTLDNCGFIEHGSSIYWAWLTPLGHMFLSFMNQYDQYEKGKTING